MYIPASQPDCWRAHLVDHSTHMCKKTPAAGAGLTRERVQGRHRGTSPIRKRLPLGPYGRPIPRAL